MNRMLVGVAIAIGLMILGCCGLVTLGLFFQTAGRIARIDRGAQEKLAAQKERNAILSVARSRQDLPVVSAIDLAEGYGSNEVRQDGLYKGKPIAVSGHVGAIGKENDKQAFVIFAGRRSKTMVACTFAQDQFSDVAQLSQGQAASIAGICTGLQKDLVTIEDCWLYAPPSGSPPERVQPAP